MTERAIIAALLAAGRASRFGGGKLDAPCAGKRLALWAIEAVRDAGFSPGLCVTGPEEPCFLCEAPGWQRVVNPLLEHGLAGSLAAAAREGERRGAAALLIVLADMPLVTPALLRDLAARAGPAATDHGGGRPGVPALIPAALFPALMASQGDRGASALLAAQPGLALVQPPGAALLDVDTPADLARAEALLAARESR